MRFECTACRAICLTCQTTFRYGKIRMRRGGLGCPNCDDGEGLQPADGRSETLDEYHGGR